MTLKEICEIMSKNRRGIYYTGKDNSKHKPAVHPIITSMHNVTVEINSADAFPAWTGSAVLETFDWTKIVPALVEQNTRFGGYGADYIAKTADLLVPLMIFDEKTRTLTMYPTSDPKTFNRLIRFDMNEDVTAFMTGAYEPVDDLHDAYISKIITHKTTLNTGRTAHRVSRANEYDTFFTYINDTILDQGYKQLFTEIVYTKTGETKVFFWVYKGATVTVKDIPSKIKGYVDTDMASARHAEITQLILSSKCLGAEACTKVWDFLYNAAKTALPEGKIGDVSDGYHTFNELYHHRAVLFAALCNLYPDYAWKSKQHDDPNFPMYDGMFICGINTPDGQATYHYDIDPYWDMFDVPELPRAPKFDGHTPAMAIERIRSLNTSYAHPTCTIKFRNAFTDECDKFLLACWKKNSAEYDYHTEFYIDGTESNGNDTFIVPFRFPGATRGHVTINGTSGRVIEVKFYATAYEDGGIACYMDTINSLIVEWEGGLMPMLADYCLMRKHGWVEITTDGCKAR